MLVYPVCKVCENDQHVYSYDTCMNRGGLNESIHPRLCFCESSWSHRQETQESLALEVLFSNAPEGGCFVHLWPCLDKGVNEEFEIQQLIDPNFLH